MDAMLTEDERAFRDEVRTFLREKLPEDIHARWLESGKIFPDKDDAVRWQKILYERGWIAPNWPEEHGGPGWTTVQKYIFATETASYGAPPVIPLGLGMVAPVIMRFGTDAQKNHFLPRILAADDYWCQGYSEPGSGSDLASLKTRAVKDGDDYVVSGSKIWTTHAHFADWMFCLARTSDEPKRQMGITFLLIPMTTPGIEVRPIIPLGGHHQVNHALLAAVRVSHTNPARPPRTRRGGRSVSAWRRHGSTPTGSTGSKTLSRVSKPWRTCALLPRRYRVGSPTSSSFFRPHGKPCP